MREPSFVERPLRFSSSFFVYCFDIILSPLPTKKGRIRGTAKANTRGGEEDSRKRDIVNCSYGLRNSLVLHRAALTVRNIQDVYTDLREVSAKPKKGNSCHRIPAVSFPI